MNKAKKDGRAQSQTPCEFIVKITQMMKNYPDIVFWSDDGKSLKFKDIQKLQEEVIPDYFRHRNILSFIRQLNMYYFSKVQSQEKDEMIFDHKIFRRGNSSNFHLIQRRNKLRDEILENMEKNYEETLTLIQNEPRLREQTKIMIRAAIEYQQIAVKNLKKIKGHIDQLTEQLKNTRGAKVKQAVLRLQNCSVPALNNLLTEGRELQSFIKNELCRDLGNMMIPNIQSIQSQNYMLLFNDHQTIKDLQAIDKPFHLPSANSLIGAHSQCSLGQNLKEQNQQDNQVSFQQQINHEI